MSMKKSIVALGALFVAAVCCSEPLQVDTGMKIPREGTPAPVVVFSAPASSVKVQVLAASQMQMQYDGDTVRISVRDLAKNAAMRQTAVKRSRDESLLLLNGGFSGSRADRPAGLLVSGGKALSIPNYTKVAAQPASTCQHLRTEHFRLSGLVCTQANGELVIGAFSQKNAEGCREAIQAGPVLVLAAPNGIAV